MFNKLVDRIKDMEAEFGFPVSAIAEINEPWDAICVYIENVIQDAKLGDTLYTKKFNAEDGIAAVFNDFKLIEIHKSRDNGNTYMFEGIPKATTYRNFNDVKILTFTESELKDFFFRIIDDILEVEFNFKW